MTRRPTTVRRNDTALRIILPVAVLLMFFLPLGLFISELVSAHRQYLTNTGYEPVNAMIVASSVHRYKGSKGAIHYSPEVRYRYEVGGKTYESDRLMAVYVSGDEEWAQEIVDRFKIETSTKAYYDPREPSRAVLLKRFSFSPYFDMLMMSFALAGGSFLILQVWTERSRSVTPTGNGWYEVPPKLAAKRRLLIAGVCTAIWYGLGAVAIAHYFTFVPGPHPSWSITRIEIYALMGLVPLGFLIRYLLMRRELTDARLAVDRPVAVSGQPFRFSILQDARRPLELKYARVRFRCIATKVQGKSRKHDVLYEAVPVELKNHSLHAGESLTLSGELTPSSEQPPTGRDASGKFTRIDWSMKLECHIAHGPNYVVEYPLTVEAARGIEPDFPRVKPAVVVDVQRVDSEQAGRILSKSNVLIGNLIGLSPFLFQLAGAITMAATFLTVFPDKSASQAGPGSNRPRAVVWFTAGAAVVVVASIFGLAFPNLLAGRYISSIARRAISSRRDAIVRPGDGSVFVDVVPRANWNRMMWENAADIGFLAVDPERREIRFEGDKERYRIPAEAIISCELAKSVLLSTAKPNAPGFWMAVIKAWEESGIWEAPIAPRLSSSLLWGGRARKKVAEDLQIRINALIKASNCVAGSSGVVAAAPG